MKNNDHFAEVCNLVESGFTISEALDELGVHGSVFYKAIDKDQKLTLNQLRTANKMYGTENHNHYETKDLHEFFTNDYAY